MPLPIFVKFSPLIECFIVFSPSVLKIAFLILKFKSLSLKPLNNSPPSRSSTVEFVTFILWDPLVSFAIFDTFKTASLFKFKVASLGPKVRVFLTVKVVLLSIAAVVFLSLPNVILMWLVCELSIFVSPDTIKELSPVVLNTEFFIRRLSPLNSKCLVVYFTLSNVLFPARLNLSVFMAEFLTSTLLFIVASFKSIFASLMLRFPFLALKILAFKFVFLSIVISPLNSAFSIFMAEFLTSTLLFIVASFKSIFASLMLRFPFLALKILAFKFVFLSIVISPLNSAFSILRLPPFIVAFSSIFKFKASMFEPVKFKLLVLSVPLLSILEFWPRFKFSALKVESLPIFAIPSSFAFITLILTLSSLPAESLFSILIFEVLSTYKFVAVISLFSWSFKVEFSKILSPSTSLLELFIRRYESFVISKDSLSLFSPSPFDFTFTSAITSFAPSVFTLTIWPFSFLSFRLFLCASSI